VNSVKASLAHAKQAIYTANKQYVQHYVHVVFLAHEPGTLLWLFFTGQMPSWPNQQRLCTEGGKSNSTRDDKLNLLTQCECVIST